MSNYSINEFQKDSKFKHLSMPFNSGSFPVTLEVVGHTKTLTFTQNIEKAMNNEFWDGEEMHYHNAETEYQIVFYRTM